MFAIGRWERSADYALATLGNGRQYRRCASYTLATLSRGVTAIALKNVVPELSKQAKAAIKGEPEPRWPGFLALLAGAGLHYALPSRLSVGPDWVLPVIIAALLVVVMATHRRGLVEWARWLTFAAVVALTLALITSLALLIQGLPAHKDKPAELLRSAAVLWITNVLVFALWYWKLDAGGPTGRDLHTGESPIPSSFLFPQMIRQPIDITWAPEFIDYLFLAFNTSTAFSPTDTAVLDGWAKIMTMLQSLISLSVLVVLAARAINVL
jgi:hypothetical protein